MGDTETHFAQLPAIKHVYYLISENIRRSDLREALLDVEFLNLAGNGVATNAQFLRRLDAAPPGVL